MRRESQMVSGRDTQGAVAGQSSRSVASPRSARRSLARHGAWLFAPALLLGAATQALGGEPAAPGAAPPGPGATVPGPVANAPTPEASAAPAAEYADAGIPSVAGPA